MADRSPLATRRSLLAAGVAGLALAACQRREAPVDESGRIRIRLALDARANVEHGGYYLAAASGAYARRGLTVQIVQGGPDIGVPRQLSSGAVELGLSSSSFVPMNLLAEGAPVRAVAAFFQKDPQVLITRPAPTLTGVADLEDRPFLLSSADRAGVWTWLRARFGFSDSQLRELPPELAAAFSDPRAVIAGTLSRTPMEVSAAIDVQPRSFLLADEGYPSYGSIVMTTIAFARDNAEALRAFIAASAEGWRDYIQGEGGTADQRAADALIRRDNPAMTQAMINQGRAALKTASIISGGDAALYGLGAMTGDRWLAFFEAGREAGLYPSGLEWRQAFTNAYLPGRR